MMVIRGLPTDTRGLTLIEVLVAITIMSIVLVALGGLMFDLARQTRLSAATTYRSAAAQRAAAWVEGLPWDSITPAAGCTSGVSGQLTYDRCVSVVDSTVRMKIITVVVTPTGILTAIPDTIVVIRNRARSESPIQ